MRTTLSTSISPARTRYTHRLAGAHEVLVSSARRWALMHELRGEAEPTLAELVPHLSPVDLVIVEGFKAENHPKLEVHRSAVGKPLLYPNDPNIVAIASDHRPRTRRCRRPISTTSKRSPISSTSSLDRFRRERDAIGRGPRAGGRTLRSLRRRESRRAARGPAVARVGGGAVTHGCASVAVNVRPRNRGGSRGARLSAADAL